MTDDPSVFPASRTPLSPDRSRNRGSESQTIPRQRPWLYRGLTFLRRVGLRRRGWRWGGWAIAAIAIVIVLNLGGLPWGDLGGASAQTKDSMTPLQPDIPAWKITVDTLWTLLAGMLVVFMNAGFAIKSFYFQACILSETIIVKVFFNVVCFL